MAAYEVEIPGKGKFRVEAQGELTQEQAYRAALGQADMLRMADPTTGMGSFQRGRAAFGKAFSDLGTGINQLVSGAPRAAEIAQDVAETRTLDAPLMKTTAGKVGNFAGNLAMFAPTMMIPGANTYTGAALAGSAMGTLQPVAENESRVTNAALGAGAGLLGQGVGNLIGRALRPVQSQPSGQAAELVREAAARNIPLTAGQATGSRPVQIVESVMENLPFTSGPQLAQKQGQKEAFNRAVGETFGVKGASAITPEVAGEARRTIGQKFTELAGRNELKVTDEMRAGLQALKDDAAKFETSEVARIVTNRIDDLLGKEANGVIPGLAYRKFDSALGRTMRSTTNGDLRNALGEVRNIVRGSMDDSISTADQAAWREARKQYANLSTVAPLAAKSETGDVPGRTLLSAANAANQNAKFGAQSELATLGRVGRAFVADQIPNSGTAQRQFYQSLLTGGAGSGLGAGAALATGNDPLTGALAGVGVTAGGLAAPRAVQAFMNSPAGYKYLTRGLLALTAKEREMLRAATSAGAGGLIGYAGQ